MNNKLNIQQQMTNGLFIRKEIQRFESVHPNIYSVYDLIDTITDFNLQQQIREHIVNIEDSFVNSQEWTLSRSVPDIKLGILGSINSGKSALVHRFLTGTYMQEESPEGGRFKKEVVIDGQSYLLLIRDEGGPPQMEFIHWVDAVIFVFSLENEESFITAREYYLKMIPYRNMNDVPFILVGTQDFISENNPRLIDDTKARNLANELKRCVYYETCATYGLHVERVFHDACQKVVNQRTQLLYNLSVLTTTTSNNQQQSKAINQSTSSIRLLAGQLASTSAISSPTSTIQQNSAALVSSFGGSTLNQQPTSPTYLQQQQVQNSISFFQSNPNLINSSVLHTTLTTNQQNSINGGNQIFIQNQNVFKEPLSVNNNQIILNQKFLHSKTDPEVNNTHKLDSITPCSTPSQKRKDTNRRRSNLFTPNKKEDKRDKLSDMGIGRSIPIKQGFLYKKTNSSLNKDWKKKFVTLNDDGSLRYYPSMNDYMEDVHGKEIDLQKTTIKMPGANKPRIGKNTLTTTTLIDTHKLSNDINSMNLNGIDSSSKNGGFEDGVVIANSSLVPPGLTTIDNIQTNYLARIDSNSKKKHRRVKSNHKADQNKEDEQEGFEFIIVSLDNKQWHFEAASADEREEWVQAVEQQILSSLQSNETNKFKNKLGGLSADNMSIQAMKNVPGNHSCVDCDAPNPVWATLNYGALICIECSGIHRNLGTHLSRVRSLELDDWSNELVQVMTSIGNKMINSIYEGNLKGKTKPNNNTIRDEKEKWIRAKYEAKQFLAPLQSKDSIGKQLIEAINKQDVYSVVLILSYSKPEDVNTPISNTDKRTCLHLAASSGNIVIMQLLIWNGADIESVDNNGKNALSYAKISNSQECMQLLLFNGSHDNDLNNSINANGNHVSTLTRRSQSTSSNSHMAYDKLPFNVV